MGAKLDKEDNSCFIFEECVPKGTQPYRLLAG